MIRCATRGCGREVRQDQVEHWLRNKKRNPKQAGPFCCEECARDYRRDQYAKARKAALESQSQQNQSPHTAA
jgi:hypothetical protein